MRALRLLLPLLLVPIGLFGQDYVQPDSITPSEPRQPDPRPLADRLYFGGNVGLSFGTVSSISVEPFVGYKIDQRGKLSVGTGISYWYYKDSRYTPELETNSYGYRIFSRYRIFQPVYLHVEWSQQNYEVWYIDGHTDRQWVPMLLVGGGYVAGSENTSFMIQILWDVLQDPLSPYGGQPIISMGVGFGF